MRTGLEESFGADTLRLMRPFTPVGEPAGTLSDQLTQLEQLFTGAAAVAARDLGMPVTDEDAARRFLAWKASAEKDGDIGGDARMMVPVFYDEQRRKTKVWVLLGWRATPVDASYRVPPTVLAVEPTRAARSKHEEPPVIFTEERYDFATPVTAEVYVTRLLDRDEFRRHCDRYITADAILANLR